MRITILCVGKIKEKFYSQAIDEYRKRLNKYCQLEIIEVPDEKTPENASENFNEKIKEKEANALMKYIKAESYVITLEIKGKMLDSVELANHIEECMVNGKSHLIFIIGGSLGLHSMISEKADYRLSFSKMTFPHQLMRVILAEQIYRSFRIMNKEPYHK